MKCFLCREGRGTVYADERICVDHGIEEDQPTAYLGWFVVSSKRHAVGLAELNDAEAQAIGLWVARLARSLKREGAEHVYSFVLGNKYPHVHVHVVPRFPGTPQEFWGFRILEWPGARRGGPAEAAEWSRRVRGSLDRAR